MREIRYVPLDPTGNLTCLVLDPVAEEDRPRVTAALMNRCEQVGYLLPAKDPGAAARLQMMGGEFCGNAAMATAAFLARERGRTEGETEIPLEVSGAAGVVNCRVRRETDTWIGKVEMPPVRKIEKIRVDGRNLTAVELPGMTHLIDCGAAAGKEEAEKLIRRAAEEMNLPAAGLLRWDEAGAYMTPLVYVRESRTLVWETACGSGSTAIAAWKAKSAGHSLTVPVHQPGGVLTVDVETAGEEILSVHLTGRIRIGIQETVCIQTTERKLNACVGF